MQALRLFSAKWVLICLLAAAGCAAPAPTPAGPATLPPLTLTAPLPTATASSTPTAVAVQPTLLPTQPPLAENPTATAALLEPSAVASACPSATPCPAWVIQPSRAGSDQVCAQPASTTLAAAQFFEGGRLIWLKEPGLYYFLTNAGGMYSVHDPLTVYRDTSAQYAPPAGRYAPVSDFGIVWRGDYLPEGSGYAEELSSYRQSLGWATAPEFEYQTTYQCGSQACTGCTTNYCRLFYPDGRPILVTHLAQIYGGEWEFLK